MPPAAPGLALVALLALVIGAPAAARAECSLADAPVPLDRRNPQLQTRLERGLRDAGLGPAIDRRDLTVSLVDLTRDDTLPYAGIHDDLMIYAASLPKIAILVALFEGIERGDVPWSDAYRWKIEKMINISNNAEATWAAEQVGLREIGRVMKDPRYCFYEPGEGGLWAGRAYRKGGPSHREPLKSLSHASSARQAARWYVMLDRGLLVTPYWSRYMRERMAPPEYFHKFVGGLRDRPGARFVARKSGTWSTFHSDSAIVQHGHVRYALVALANHGSGEGMLRDLARVVDDIMLEGAHRRWRATNGWQGRRP